MKNKIPTTELEIELLCDKIILQQELKKVRMHLWALQEVLKEKSKNVIKAISKPQSG
jgi:hypothetical protein